MGNGNEESFVIRRGKVHEDLIIYVARKVIWLGDGSFSLVGWLID